MIVEEMIDGRVRHYSDVGMMIRQQPTGILYEDAVDVVPCRFTYEETDIPIEEDGSDATEEDFTSALHTLGVDAE